MEHDDDYGTVICLAIIASIALGTLMIAFKVVIVRP